MRSGSNEGNRMRRLRRIIVNTQSILSLLLCVATAGEGFFPSEDCGSVPGYEECARISMLTQTEIKKIDPGEREEILSLKKWTGDGNRNRENRFHPGSDFFCCRGYTSRHSTFLPSPQRFSRS